MPRLPAVAHQVGSTAVPTPQQIIMGGHPGYAGNGHTVPIQDQIYGMILPRQGHPFPRAVAGAVRAGASRAGASRADAIRLSGHKATRRKKCPKGQVSDGKGGCKWPPIVLPTDTGDPLGRPKPVCPAGTHRCGSFCCNDAYAGKSHADAIRLGAVAGANRADAVRLSSGSGRPVAGSDNWCYQGCVDEYGTNHQSYMWCVNKCHQILGAPSGSNPNKGRPGRPGRVRRKPVRAVAGANQPPPFDTFRDYPGSLQRHDARVRAQGRGGMAGAMYPPSYPDYPGNPQRRDVRSRRALAGGHHHHHDDHHEGACCDSCAHGGACEGCDGAGGCGKPNCGCN